jgi:hypothetical protein
VKESAASCTIVTNVVPRQMRPIASLSDTSNSSTMGNHPRANHMTVDTLFHRSISRNPRCSGENHSPWPLYVGVLPLPPPHTPLPRTQVYETAMRAMPPPSRQHGHHCTMRVSSRPPTHMVPLRLPANTDQAHLLCHCVRATPPTNHHHYLTKTGLGCGASKEGARRQWH